MRTQDNLRGSEERITELMVVLLDYLSRIQQGMEQGNWAYVCDKIPRLVRTAEVLSTVLRARR
jgi:hypothetical protein